MSQSISKPLYPVVLDLADRSVLIVGAGRVAARKLPSLLQSGARVTVVSPEVAPTVARFSDALEVLQRPYREGDEQGRFLVFACTGSKELNAKIARRCRERGLLCDAVHDASLSGFHTPATIRRGDILVTVSSGGESPSLSRYLRRRLESLLPLGVEEIAERIGAWRSSLKKQGKIVPGELPWASLFQTWQDSGAIAVTEMLERLHAQPSVTTPETGKVWLVGSGPGHPGLVTLLAMEVLQQAEVVIHDRLIPMEALDWIPPECERFEVGKRGHFTSTRQEDIHALMLKHAKRGKRVVRLKGGDPFIFGRGWEEVRFLEVHGIPWSVVPGVSSATAVPEWCGFPLTSRGEGRSFAVMSAMSFSQTNRDIPKADTVVVLMGFHVLPELMESFRREGWPGDTPAAALEKGTLPGQRVCLSTLDLLAAETASRGFESPVLLVIGQAAKMAALHGHP